MLGQMVLPQVAHARPMAVAYASPRAPFPVNAPGRRSIACGAASKRLQTWKNGRMVEVEVSDETKTKVEVPTLSGTVGLGGLDLDGDDEAEVEEEEAAPPPPPPEAKVTVKAKAKAKAKAKPKAKAKAKKAAPPPPPAQTPAPAMSTMLQIFKADFTVNSIVDKINRGKLDLKPSYQREFVWTIKVASRLVESLLLNVPIPTMFFHETAEGVLEVVDGKQRLTSIWSYMQEEFPDGTPFRLNGLEVYTEINNKKFSDLSEQHQETIKDYALNVHTISRHCEPDFVFEVFERLNMGATQLNEQELRNCIYQGPYTDLLGELASNEHLRKIYKSDTPHIRMKDRELILRFFVMRADGPEGFTLPVKAWLNKEIRNNMDLGEEDMEEMRGAFEDAIFMAWEVFGEVAFRPLAKDNETFDNGEINIPLFDTIMYSFSLVDPEDILPHKEAVLAAFIEMSRDPKAEFRKKLLSKPQSTVQRHEQWWPRLLGAIGAAEEEEEEEEEDVGGEGEE